MIKLEKFGKADYNRLIGWVNSEEELAQFSGPVFTYPLDTTQLDTYLQDANRLVFKVVDPTTDRVVGHAELDRINPVHSSARICRILIGNEKDRNRGLGKAVIRELVQIGFKELRLHRIDLGVFDFNTQAIRCYQACGFEIEGLLKENFRVGTEYWSVYNMAIINRE